jgi:hypothetical protein
VKKILLVTVSTIAVGLGLGFVACGGGGTTGGTGGTAGSGGGTGGTPAAKGCVQCAAAADCQTVSAIACPALADCNCTGGMCVSTKVACTTATEGADCTAVASMPKCANSGTPTAFCGCSTDLLCNYGVNKCNTSSHLCAMCDTDAECAAGTLTKCMTATGQCGCAGNADCTTAGYGICKTATGACVACAASADCTGTYKKCDTATNTCVCNASTECSATADYGTTCRATNKYIADGCGCKDDAECKAGIMNDLTGYGSKCNATSGLCDCTADKDCQDSLGKASAGVLGKCL